MLPQAVRNVVPPLLNDFISLQKDVALVSVLGIVEAFRVAQIDAASAAIAARFANLQVTARIRLAPQGGGQGAP